MANNTGANRRTSPRGACVEKDCAYYSLGGRCDHKAPRYDYMGECLSKKKIPAKRKLRDE